MSGDKVVLVVELLAVVAGQQVVDGSGLDAFRWADQNACFVLEYVSACQNIAVRSSVGR